MTASAIPHHLRVDRTVPPTRNPPKGDSAFASFSHILPETVTTLSIAYIGVQSATVSWERLADTIRNLDRDLEIDYGPDHHDRARFVDQAGYKTIVIAAYWLKPDCFTRWWNVDGLRWVDPETTPDGFGRFIETLQPSVDRVETIISSSEAREGFGAIAERTSPPIAEHGYWGSMRDRLPITQVDTVRRGDSGPTFNLGRRVDVVRLDANACVIRSGQDYSDTRGDERQYYLQHVEPTLRRGMEFLRDSGLPIGCYVNRYVQIVDAEFAPTEKSYAVSWWVDMGSLEAWAKSHPTHVAIFASFMQHMTRFDQDARLRLYHEVMVPTFDQQVFRYLDCHPRTGLLAASPTD
ncbi:MAG: aliphatic aldoxime dehydratase [Mycobacterium sp.]|nr:aliphatic aldoxime dehydratase [Mycobacterium sp.]